MISKLKILGLMLVAAAAMNLAAACVAIADVFTSEKIPLTLTGAQQGSDVVKIHSGEIKCTTVNYTASVVSLAASTVLATPTYSGCTFVGLNAKVTMNECSYLIHINSAGSTAGTMDIVCPLGKEITVTAPSAGTPKCIIHYPAQNSLGPATGKNIGSSPTKEVLVEIQINNKQYSQTAGSAETGNCATADNTTGGAYTGKALFTGENSAGTEHIGIFLS